MALGSKTTLPTLNGSWQQTCSSHSSNSYIWRTYIQLTLSLVKISGGRPL